MLIIKNIYIVNNTLHIVYLYEIFIGQYCFVFNSETTTRPDHRWQYMHVKHRQ